jgi:mannose-6-phosphate isomerase-like protein (cupin superfamily)
MQSTRGHKHQGQEEVYHFISGYGKMELDDRQFHVKGGDIVLIPDGSFHRVHNTSEHGALYFICVLTVIKENGFTNYSNDVEMG